MEDLQLNITHTKKDKKGASSKKSSEYKFLPQSTITGKIIARKRPSSGLNKPAQSGNIGKKSKRNTSELSNSQDPKTDVTQSNLRDLSENKGKFKAKNYQEISDNIQLKQKPRSGGWISSLFKNNPDVPRLGQRAVKPLMEKVFSSKNFSDLDIHPHSVANLSQNLGLKELMTVQQNSVPVILQGRDVLIRSQTGSGKTLAYALPIIEGLQAIRPKVNRLDGIRVVVVVPTRELAVQTYELFVKLVKPFTWIVPGLLSGGQKRKAEKARLRKGLSILVGTPGRINDHLRHTKSLNFAKASCLVLDEADRLLDMGYEKDVAAIVKSIDEHKKAAEYDPIALIKQNAIKKFDDDNKSSEEEEKLDACASDEPAKHNLTKVFLSKARQTILLSATLTKAVENLAGITMVDPVFIDTSDGRTLVADSLQAQQAAYENNVLPVKTKEAKGKSDEEIRQCTKNNKKTVTDLKLHKIETRRGLKEFSGLNLIGSSEEKGESGDSGNSDDSDSDYEYIKEQKEQKNQISKVNHVEFNETNETANVVKNSFEQAVTTALVEDELILPATVNQTFLIVPMKLRLVSLCSLIVEHCAINKKSGKMIVFMATLEMVDYHSDLIEQVLTGKNVKVNKNKESKTKQNTGKRKNDKVDTSSSESDSEFKVEYEAPLEGGVMPVEIEMFSLHGSMPHEQRIEVFKQFRQAKNGVLICTDVAARGLDVPRVDLVLQYCAPASATDYVHRVGRTGRAAQVGAAVLFLLPSESEFVRHLEQKRIRLRQSDESRALEALRTICPTAASAQRAAIALQARLENVAHTNRDWLARASRAYTSWVRFYSGYPLEVRPYLDARQLHLGHAAKAFALRDTPAALARRAKSDLQVKDKPNNRLTVQETEEKKRPGFPKVKVGVFGNKIQNKQSSMHTASEFDSGLGPVEPAAKKKKKKIK